MMLVPRRQRFRLQSRASSTDSKRMSPHVTTKLPSREVKPQINIYKVGFYRSFGRPIAKVFLGAMFTYQIVYLLWHKLEIEEIKVRKNGTNPQCL